MHNASTKSSPTTSSIQLLLTYVADLELEVDRLRKQAQFVREEVRGTLRNIRTLCTQSSPVADSQNPLSRIDQTTNRLAEVMRDLYEPPGYHPTHDQVIAIAVRPLAEQLFRWQQRLSGAMQAVLSLELESDHVEWFPARLRHILDNLLANALKHQDHDKVDKRVTLGLRIAPEGYEFRVSHNGIDLPQADRQLVYELFYRAAPTRAAGIGVGLSVVMLLVEQSGGKLTLEAGNQGGTTLVAVLPRFDVDDFLI